MAKKSLNKGTDYYGHTEFDRVFVARTKSDTADRTDTALCRY